MVSSITVESAVEDYEKTNWYVYLIETECGHLYTGSTTNPTRRFRQHRGELAGGAKFLKARKPRVYRAIFQIRTKSAALKLECRIKRLSRQQKLNVISSHLLDDMKLDCALDRVESTPHLS
ncbi:GIY-YIG nuclease family protein [Alteromonas sp. ASW11-130]|uniref:GIY-YIG nuclease family protein n=1 Tax=Alteromonas sp. ASW11-130 TaxID=3015775 RepID=UPI002242AE77|nr:GIY-YIG nuclease family protein [Alteromonas sp. ASW11-130]MCW8091259.1 GIY-YIG nuclease family protein [Alteromonas sp. ASW11-130]